jgi:integrase
MPGVEFVFRGIKDPTKPLSYNMVAKAFRRIAQRAGVDRCTLHTIRHWFVTMTANSVSNARVGMALTGHKSHAAYMNYVHGDKEQVHALADQLAALAIGLAKAGSNVAPLAISRQTATHRSRFDGGADDESAAPAPSFREVK